jgi:hypothetical protein
LEEVVGHFSFRPLGPWVMTGRESDSGDHLQARPEAREEPVAMAVGVFDSEP